MKRLFITLLFLGAFTLLSDSQAYAASIINASDVITSSYPATPAAHTVQFTTQTTIPSNGKVFIGFPGVANNTASPSANSFAFNGLTSANIQTSNITCSSWTISAPSITCVTSSSVTSGTVITFLIGCSTSTGATCTSVNPIIINPSKTNPVGTGDLSKIRVSTFDASANELDTAAVSMTTIEGVVVSIGVEESMTFTIGGINNGQPVNTQNTTGCSNTETTNSGVSSTSSLVSLGILGNTPKDINTKVSNIAAQLLTISTNATGGYVISATSSALRSKTSSATIA